MGLIGRKSWGVELISVLKRMATMKVRFSEVEVAYSTRGWLLIVALPGGARVYRTHD